jgi:hypothetical protein
MVTDTKLTRLQVKSNTNGTDFKDTDDLTQGGRW